MDLDQLLEALRAEAAALAPSWAVSATITRPAGRPLITIELEHPASQGLLINIDPDHGRPHEWLHRSIEATHEVAIASAAPELEHPRLVMGLRTLIQSHGWNAREVRGVSFLLHDTGALTADEAAWLAGYCAVGDAPMAPQPPD